MLYQGMPLVWTGTYRSGEEQERGERGEEKQNCVGATCVSEQKPLGTECLLWPLSAAVLPLADRTRGYLKTWGGDSA